MADKAIKSAALKAARDMDLKAAFGEAEGWQVDAQGMAERLAFVAKVLQAYANDADDDRASDAATACERAADRLVEVAEACQEAAELLDEARAALDKVVM